MSAVNCDTSHRRGGCDLQATNRRRLERHRPGFDAFRRHALRNVCKRCVDIQRPLDATLQLRSAAQDSGIDVGEIARGLHVRDVSCHDASNASLPTRPPRIALSFSVPLATTSKCLASALRNVREGSVDIQRSLNPTVQLRSAAQDGGIEVCEIARGLHVRDVSSHGCVERQVADASAENRAVIQRSAGNTSS
jgi:hypothetical protein